MAEKITGSFPGGPRKSVPAAERAGAPRLSRVEEIEERRAARRSSRAKGRRRKRAVIGFLASVVAAGSVGLYLGMQSHVTIDDLRDQQAAQAEAAPSSDPLTDLSSEVNRTLLELWRMEDVEYQRNSR